ncbi:MAG: PAC2 family protein [Phycisphaerales bacterium]|nr:PAC2 family protein [Phycisphaerales bacterium]
MPTAKPDTSKWLVAAWPGMGNVAVLSAGYLLQKLGFEAVGELPPQGRFDIENVDVHGGLIETPRLPRNLLFRHPEPAPGRDFTIFLGESQPSTGSYGFAHELIEAASRFGIERVVTFASIASQLHPSKQPRVFGAATSKETLDEMARAEIRNLEEGQIGGLNGVVLGAAAKRGLVGVCLLGEIPFFAAGVPNPKTARAVLGALAQLGGFRLDMTELDKHVSAMDTVMLRLLEKLQSEQGITIDEEDDAEHEVGTGEKDEEASRPKPAPTLDFATRQRIENLFDETRRDRTKAMSLKQELDKLGVFSQYENRFLDLFKRAE